jgi:hypothetical protein
MITQEYHFVFEMTREYGKKIFAYWMQIRVFVASHMF